MATKRIVPSVSDELRAQETKRLATIAAGQTIGGLYYAGGQVAPWQPDNTPCLGGKKPPHLCYRPLPATGDAAKTVDMVPAAEAFSVIEQAQKTLAAAIDRIAELEREKAEAALKKACDDATSDFLRPMVERQRRKIAAALDAQVPAAAAIKVWSDPTGIQVRVMSPQEYYDDAYLPAAPAKPAASTSAPMPLAALGHSWATVTLPWQDRTPRQAWRVE